MNPTVYRTMIFVVWSALFLAACQNRPAGNEAAGVKRFALRGEVVEVDPVKKTASIKHEKIAGYMDAMTMDFPIREDWVWGDLTKGSEIRAELVVDDVKGEFWLEKIAIVAAPNPNQPAPPVNTNFAQIGKEIPEFSLINQDGKKISAKDFRGKALAITFIYSRCPLPNFCILMSKNFSDAANQLMKNAELKDRIRLLSISFDPANDTPAKLKQYGLGYLGKDAKPDFTVWQLATGSDAEIRSVADFFGLRYEIDENDKTQFNHSLRTIVVAPDGKVRKIIAGNEWTADDLLTDLEKTL